MIDMLNGCDRVLAVSEFVRRKFESLGVKPEVIRTLHIGSRINRLADHHHRLIFDPPPFTDEPWDRQRPIRVVFMGYNHYYKGLGMFAESLDMLEARHLGRIDLSVYAGRAVDRMDVPPHGAAAGPPDVRLRLPVRGHPVDARREGPGRRPVGLVGQRPADRLRVHGLPRAGPGGGSGGIPDFVRDGENGLLFRGNDRRHLAQRLVEVIENPRILNDLRARVRRPKDIETHAVELEGVYGALSRR